MSDPKNPRSSEAQVCTCNERQHCAVCIEAKHPPRPEEALPKRAYHPPGPVDVRFWQKAERRGPGECWPWHGSTDRVDRGHLYIEGRLKQAAHVSWSLHYGEPFPVGLVAMHTCDNPNCVNPMHIVPGTQSQNMRDMGAKGRQKAGPRQPWLLSADETRALLERHRAGASLRSIAREHGVHRSRIRRIFRSLASA